MSDERLHFCTACLAAAEGYCYDHRPVPDPLALTDEKVEARDREAREADRSRFIPIENVLAALKARNLDLPSVGAPGGDGPRAALRSFTYLLNAMERAAQETCPADHGYAAKRQAVLGFVDQLVAGGPARGEPGEPSKMAAEAFLAAHGVDVPSNEAGIRAYPRAERIKYVRKWLRAAYAVDFPPGAGSGPQTPDEVIEGATAMFFGYSLDKWRQFGPMYRVEMETNMSRALAAVPRSSGAPAEAQTANLLATLQELENRLREPCTPSDRMEARRLASLARQAVAGGAPRAEERADDV